MRILVEIKEAQEATKIMIDRTLTTVVMGIIMVKT
jgi:hypothetical protein